MGRSALAARCLVLAAALTMAWHPLRAVAQVAGRVRIVCRPKEISGP